ncbi:capsule synthesis protein PGA_cap [Nannocystis exedens]|uniref:Capsule synthesis protein PGA_cap n=1 Tax=Nannocystis exedens TaxID=54 RepID=A0A1I1XHQ5_9BACT|nr:CapA family protein [Nannocystis exedens]PCC73398.1 carbohydrate-binding protein [Nannocystis exedens]SFE06934.1 capsule synthesis protein PGA_cap [Nannocystis exedens]
MDHSLLARRLGPLLFAGATALATVSVRAAPEPVLSAAADGALRLRGRIVDRDGRPLVGVTVEAVDFAATRRPPRVVSGPDGRFLLPGLPRRSLLLRLTHGSHYRESIPIDLQRPARLATLDVGELEMTARRPWRVRLMFVGDTMFGRRFVDGDEDGVEGEPGDLIRPGSRAADAERVLRFVRDVLASADYTVANLECVVTDRPDTPHPYKPYVLHSHPDAVQGLVNVGVDAVSSGNNHVFDFLAPGVADTLGFLAAAGLDRTGAGMSEREARRTAIVRRLHDVDVALLGLSQMRFDGLDLADYHLVAEDPAKSGALYASPENLGEFLADAGEAFAVPMLHGGAEYGRYPTADMRALFVDAIAGGAGLVVAHHPHVLQGVGVAEGPDARRFVLMSLGNFLFDQTTHDTVESVIAVVDVDARGGGHEVERVELIPVRLDGYVPRLLAGEALARVGRLVAHLSTNLPGGVRRGERDGLRGAVVFPSRHRVLAFADPRRYAFADTREPVRLAVLGRDSGAVTFARRGPADSLARVDTDVPADIVLGRDLLDHGDFEDLDVDGEVGDAFGWEQRAAAFVQGRTVRHGVRAAALRRAADDDETTSLVTRRRVPIDGDKPITIRGYLRGEAAGEVVVRVRFFVDAALLGEQVVFTQKAGSYDWARFAATVTPPAGARGMHLSFRQDRPPRGAGVAFLDDVSAIQWERTVASGEAIPTPNKWDFVRFRDVAPNITRMDAVFTHRRYVAR